ncbi:two-component system sensor histidine kinase RstB [Vogesella sp. LIG4]|uniref:two-component system sensor histidine kinase RstB n=1 Tax=Vogesella sp. LIG4 TaxID=1192162 RepID=UPI00081FAB1D|nr:two-component system sensor histidine kinase RstB [Vogesella sp. LIG4]SCK16414.1 two-component system, OmpR family, sensor histidine kinase RstB [Vogesella sp. LIG4]
MRKLFIQFYLLLIVSFLLAVVLAGLVYKQVAEKTGDRALADLLKTSLSLIELELRDTPEAQWPQMLHTLERDLGFSVSMQRLEDLPIDSATQSALRDGNIVMLEDDDVFLQRMAKSPYALVAGPMSYLVFLHELKWFDYALLALIGLSLAIPVLLWMRPHWNELTQLERGAKALSEGEFSARVQLPARSGLQPLAQGFNQMASNVERLLESKQTLINAVAHELRTPLARLRYRLALLDVELDDATQAGIERDLGNVGALIDELLLHARLSRPDLPLQWQRLEIQGWLQQRQEDLATEYSALRVDIQQTVGAIYGDSVLLTRAMDNLLGNAARYARKKLLVRVYEIDGEQYFSVGDDGPGIPPAERQRVMEPFVRLDPSRDRAEGGHGLGLAIVQQIMLAHHGRVEVGESPLGGALFTLCWPLQQDVTSTNKS